MSPKTKTIYSTLFIALFLTFYPSLLRADSFPNIESFRADTLSVEQGGYITLTWRVSNCSRIILQGPMMQNSGYLGCEGNMSIMLSVPGMFQLVAYGPEGIQTTTSTLPVTVTAQYIRINYFKSNVTATDFGNTVTLNWSVENCSSTTISGPDLGQGGFGCSGSVSFFARVSGNYSLYATPSSGGQEMSSNIFITVYPTRRDGLGNDEDWIYGGGGRGPNRHHRRYSP